MLYPVTYNLTQAKGVIEGLAIPGGTIVDKDVTRRRNLRALLAQWGGPESLAKKLGWRAGGSYISQLLSGKRPFTEKTAHKIEKAVGLREGALDRNGEPGESAVEVDTALLAKAIVAVDDVLKSEKVRLTNEQRSRVIVKVYKESLNAKEINEANVREIVRLFK